MVSQVEPHHEIHISSYGRATSAPTNYFEPRVHLEEFHSTDRSRELGRYDLNEIDERLELLHHRCLELGFSSIFEVALADARQLKPPAGHLTTREDMKRFTEAGGFQELCSLFMEACEEVHMEKLLGNSLTSMLQEQFATRYEKILLEEWDRVCKIATLKQSVDDLGKEALVTFDFEAILQEMKVCAPNLVRLFEMFCSNPKTFLPDNLNKKSVVWVVVTLAQLANGRNPMIAFIQSMTGLYLYGSKAPKCIISMLSQLGISISHSTVLAHVKEAAKAAKLRLKKVAASGNAFQVSFDNVNFLRNVRDQRILNHSSMVSLTAGFAVVPPAFRAHPMFTKADINLSAVPDLTPIDFVPLETDRDHIQSAMEFMLADVFQRYIGTGLEDKQRERHLSKFKTPTINQIDPKERSTILTFPVFDKDEAKVPEVAEILVDIMDDVDFSKEQREENLLLVKGDLLSVRNVRLAKFRQSGDHPHMNLSCVESVAGLFHLEIAMTELVFATHLGTPGDMCMLSTWIDELRQDVNRLWVNGKGTVKDFRTCFDFISTVLDAHLVAALATTLLSQFAPTLRAEERTLAMLQDVLPDLLQTDLIEKTIKQLAKFFSRFDRVGERYRSKPEARRDLINENVNLFIQHGLILRNFDTAISSGDIGRALVSLSFFTIWLQGSNKHLYAMEMLRLTACIRKVWSPALADFYKQNCLINISGKKRAFMPDDKLNEFIVGQIKATEYAHASSEATDFMHDVRALLTMQFLDLKQSFTTQLGVKLSDFHKNEVDKTADVRIVADCLLKMCAFRPENGRGTRHKETQAADLWMDGIEELGTGVGIEKMKLKWLEETMYSTSHLLYSYAEGYEGISDAEGASEGE